MSLENLLALASSKAVAAVAGASLAVGGTAGIVVATEHAPDTTPTVEIVEVEDEPVGTTDHENGPDDHADGTAAERVHDFMESWGDAPKDCYFGLGVAAAASNGRAPLPDVCGEDAGDEEALGDDDVAATGAEDGLGRAGDEAPDEARVPVEVPAGASDDAGAPDDVPAGGPETGEAARGSAGPPSDG